MNDMFNRDIVYARISVTNSCNLNCTYCSPDNSNKNNISKYFYKNLIDALEELGIEKIRFTGGEPLLNSNIIELIEYAGKKEKIKDICITTNGILIDEYIDDLIKFGLTRINISLDTINKRKYLELTGKDCLDKVLENIKLAKTKGLTVKINAVLVKDYVRKNIQELLEFGYKNDIQVRFIELMPIGDNLNYFNEKYLSSNFILENFDCKKLEINNNDVVSYYMYDNKYKFGIISPISNHFCDRCNRIRITSKGNLRLCLHSDNEVSLLEVSEDKDAMKKIIIENVMNKPEKHLISKKKFAKSSMIQIGG